MVWWFWLLVALALVALALSLAALWLRSFRLTPAVRRVLALPWRRKLTLLRLLLSDGRVSAWTKVALPALVLYLALPIDIIPDFIPLVGHLDDLLLVVLLVTVFSRAIPTQVMEEHLGALERG
jgi:uncharacterized membrane protein YkvA (DUF1232 family)